MLPQRLKHYRDSRGLSYRGVEANDDEMPINVYRTDTNDRISTRGHHLRQYVQRTTLWLKSVLAITTEQPRSSSLKIKDIQLAAGYYAQFL
jgi:hypothetical protein